MEGRKTRKKIAEKVKTKRERERESGSGWEVALFCTFRETRDMNQPSLQLSPSFHFFFFLLFFIYMYINYVTNTVTVSNIIIKIIYISLVKMVIV